jgi:hypothetical protein
LEDIRVRRSVVRREGGTRVANGRREDLLRGTDIWGKEHEFRFVLFLTDFSTGR